MGKGRLELRKNRVRGLASLARVLAGGMALSLANLVAAAGPGWLTSFEQAVQVARQQGKPIFVDFSTSWCGVCKQMDRSTLADPAIIQRLDNFVKVKVDGDARADLMNKYGVDAYPTFLHLDPSGSRILERRAGFMRTQEMATALDRTSQNFVGGGSRAIAQVSANQAPAAGAPAANAPQIASTGLQLLSPDKPDTEQRDSRPVTNSRSQQQPADTATYDRNDPSLKDSVYAMGASPTSERRSRFGSAAGSSGLRELAEATANPNDVEQKSDEKSESAKSESSDTKKETDGKETAKSSEKSDESKTAKSDSDEDKKKSAKAEDDAKLIAETKAKVEADRKALTQNAPKQIASVLPSPVIQSRLSGIAEEELPKPLLSRTAPGATQAVAPAPIAASKTATADPLATIRKIQGNGDANPAEPAASAPKVSAKTQEIAPKTAEKAPEPAEEKEPSREVAVASEKKTVAAAAKPTEDKTESSKKSPDKSDGEKTSEGATRDDIERWMKDADSKLVADKKTEARAMYTKVVEKDPKNQFGKSDMAFVKMVSLIVDRDSDLLRRQAYNKIKEFEARYPDSEHKDYYTLIRATLAVDLGETNEAHRLLGTYPDRFPESRYRKLAHETWKELPPLKKESSKSSADSSKKSSSKSKS